MRGKRISFSITILLDLQQKCLHYHKIVAAVFVFHLQITIRLQTFVMQKYIHYLHYTFLHDNQLIQSNTSRLHCLYGARTRLLSSALTRQKRLTSQSSTRLCKVSTDQGPSSSLDAQTLVDRTRLEAVQASGRPSTEHQRHNCTELISSGFK